MCIVHLLEGNRYNTKINQTKITSFPKIQLNKNEFNKYATQSEEI